MRIMLIDVDSTIPNLALMKLSSYHKKRGDRVGFNIKDPDKIYISTVFEKNHDQVNGIRLMHPNVPIEMGGSGWDLYTNLQPNIEKQRPDYDLYPSTYSQGFTTRGCIRNCGFCIVPQKEGTIKPHHHPEDFHDDRFKECLIMDNNILAAPSAWWKSVFQWFIDHNIKMRENGMDIRLLTDESASMLKDLRLKNGPTFAWDLPDIHAHVKSGIDKLISAGFRPRDISFYILINFNTTLYKDLSRVYTLRERGVCSYVMTYNWDHIKFKRDIETRIKIKLERWANARAAYWKVPFHEYDRLNTIERQYVMNILGDMIDP